MNLSANGGTSLGKAFSKLAQVLKFSHEGGTMQKNAFPPVLVLITAGNPTDDWTKGFEELMDQFWAKEADRIAIGFEGADENILKVFIGPDMDSDKHLIMIKDADLNPHQNLFLRLTALPLTRWAPPFSRYKMYKKKQWHRTAQESFLVNLFHIIKSLTHLIRQLPLTQTYPRCGIIADPR